MVVGETLTKTGLVVVGEKHQQRRGVHNNSEQTMNIIKTIKDFFSPSIRPILENINPQFDPVEYAIDHAAKVDVALKNLIEKYGINFHSFFYTPHIDEVIKKEIAPLINYPSNWDFFKDHNWEQKHPFNFPGPFYTGESDSCGTGIVEAPNNVLHDYYTMEYVFRQPRNFSELVQVVDAAAVEVFDSYSCNGNQYWTYDKCKDWWKEKSYLLEQLNDRVLISNNLDSIQYYVDYLNSDAETDLRRYCYFLENGIYPTNENISLPIL